MEEFPVYISEQWLLNQSVFHYLPLKRSTACLTFPPSRRCGCAASSECAAPRSCPTPSTTPVCCVPWALGRWCRRCSRWCNPRLCACRARRSRPRAHRAPRTPLRRARGRAPMCVPRPALCTPCRCCCRCAAHRPCAVSRGASRRAAARRALSSSTAAVAASRGTLFAVSAPTCSSRTCRCRNGRVALTCTVLLWHSRRRVRAHSLSLSCGTCLHWH